MRAIQIFSVSLYAGNAMAAGDLTGVGLSLLAIVLAWFILCAFLFRKPRSLKARIILTVIVIVGMACCAALASLPYRPNKLLVDVGMWGCLLVVLLVSVIIRD